MDNYQQFIGSFAQYLKTGDTEPLSQFCPNKDQLPYLSIYRNGFYKACVDALLANYPSVQSIIGDDYFKSLARAYIDENLPTHGSLVGYGKDFASFLDAHTEKHSLPYLGSIAQLDYQWLQTHYANSDPSLSAEDLGSLVEARDGDIEAIQLPLHKSLVFITLDWQVTELWAQLKQNQAINQQIRLSQEQQHLMFWQQDLQVYFKPLEPDEYAFLIALQNGKSLGDASQVACQINDTFDIAGTFSALLQSGCFQPPAYAEAR